MDRPSALVALTVTIATAAAGCARVVTLTPLEVAANNDPTWRIQSVPPDTGEPGPVTPIDSPSSPMRERSNVQPALRSSLDSEGIPTALYAVDPILAAHRDEMRAEERERDHVGAGIIILGLAFGAVGAWTISDGLKQSNASDPNNQKTSQLVGAGTILAIFGLAEVIAGTVLVLTSPSSTQLTTYYKETYTSSQ